MDRIASTAIQLRADRVQNQAQTKTPLAPPKNALYTSEQRVLRDSTKWTLVQGILAPIQFLAFLLSLFLVLRYLQTGEGHFAAMVSVLVKTALLYTIMVTGCIWEKVVFGQYLFAPSFFWEDVVSMLVMALHTAYLICVLQNWLGPREQMLLALCAYSCYAINAIQFIWKLRCARLQSDRFKGPINVLA